MLPAILFNLSLQLINDAVNKRFYRKLIQKNERRIKFPNGYINQTHAIIKNYNFQRIFEYHRILQRFLILERI